MRYVAAMAVLAAAAGAARADEVVLRNGARFEGQVQEGKDTVTVVMDIGTMTFKKIDVAKIDRGPSALSEFDAKLAELKADDLDAQYRLAMWARKKLLDQRATRLLEEILERDPEHARAREALGYIRVDGRWLTEDQVKIQKGLVYFRGGWTSQEMADEIRRIEAERDAELSRIAALESMRLKEIEAEGAIERRLLEEANYYDYNFPRTVFLYGGFGYNRLNCQPRRRDHCGNGPLIPSHFPVVTSVQGPVVKPVVAAPSRPAPAAAGRPAPVARRN